MALALGEGGGSTTPEEWLASVLALAGVSLAVPPDSRGEDSAVAEPPSDCSLGICTFSRGLLPPICCAVLARLGWLLSEGSESRWGMVFACFGGDAMPSIGLLRGWMAPTSTDCDRFSFSTLASRVSLLFPSPPQCCANSDRLSSIGVKMLRDLAGTGFARRFDSFSGCGSCLGCGGDRMDCGCC